MARFGFSLRRSFLWGAALLLFELPSFAADFDSRLEILSKSRYWQLLLHRRHDFRGSLRSEADGEFFFFSPQGKSSALEELKATIAALQDNNEFEYGGLKQRARCAFPERLRFLNAELSLNLERGSCPDFERWKQERGELSSLTLIYAAPYLGSPASMFGHTFLRLNSTQNKGTEVLDQTLGFEAYTGEEAQGVLYAIKGLAGFYPGLFSLAPFYIKRNLYLNMESRDLWEFEIPLSPAQAESFLNHLWELGSTYFSYYFFDENCSYHLLSLLEITQPELRLREKFFFMVIPADTVRVAREAFTNRGPWVYRPSILEKLNRRYELLTESEKERFSLLKSGKTPVNQNDSALLVDSLLEWQRYKAMSEARTLYDPEKKVEKTALLLRAKMAPDPRETLLNDDPQGNLPPDVGHDSSKISLGAFKESSKQSSWGARFEWRAAYHDYTDADAGYLPHSLLTVGKLSVEKEFQQQRALRLSEFVVADVGSLSAYNLLRKNIAWRTGGGLYRPIDLSHCPSCIAGYFRTAGGLSLGVPSAKGRWVVYGLGRGNLEAAGRFKSFLRIGPSVELGTLADGGVWGKFSAAFEAFYLFPRFREDGRFSVARLEWGLPIDKQFQFKLSQESRLLWKRNSHQTTLVMSAYY